MRIFSLTLFLWICSSTALFAQTTTVASNYKHVRVNTANNASYQRTLILLHPIYDGIDLAANYVVGQIVARRGGTNAYNRFDIAYVNSSSAYRQVAANMVSHNTTAQPWRLKTCYYHGVKYMALDIPYENAHHAHGIEFAGWSLSSGESFTLIAYSNNGVPQNTSILTDIQDYVPNMDATQAVRNFNVLGNVGIGTSSPSERLSVNGNIRAREIKVETSNWPDYVFQRDYELMNLAELETYIRENGHLPEIPNAAEIEEDGVSLGEMNKLLLKKVEELTLHIIRQQKTIDKLVDQSKSTP